MRAVPLLWPTRKHAGQKPLPGQIFTLPNIGGPSKRPSLPSWLSQSVSDASFPVKRMTCRSGLTYRTACAYRIGPAPLRGRVVSGRIASAERDCNQPLRELAGGLLQAPLHHARVPERAFVDGPDDGDGGAQILLDRLEWTLHPAPKPGILVAGPIPRLSRTRPAPRL